MDDQLLHYDLFLETASELLETYELNPTESDDLLYGGEIILAIKKTAHRYKYLDFSGELNKNQGTVIKIWEGEYEPPEFFSDQSFIQIKNFVLYFLDKGKKLDNL